MAGNVGRWRAAVGPALAFLVSLAVYFRTMSPTVSGLDSGELTVAAYTLGIPHATGYPTYLLIGYLFTHLPGLTPAFGANLMSAVFAAATTALVYLLALRLTERAGMALGAALSLAFSYFFWGAALAAEVYTLHTFFLAVLLLLLWPTDVARRPNRLILAALVFGLSLGNHMSTLLLVPGLLVLAVFPHPREIVKPTVLALCMSALLIGTSVYLYLPLRYLAQAMPSMAGWYNASGAFTSVDLASPAGLRWMVSAEMFRGLMFAYGPAALAGELARYVDWLRGNYLGVGLAVGLVGLYEMLRASRREGVALALIFLANVAFFVDYAAVDKRVMFLPTYIVWALWLAVGLAELMRLTEETTKRLSRTSWATTVRAVALWWPCLPALAALLVNFQLVDLSADLRAEERARRVLAEVDAGALVLGLWSDAGSLRYLQLVDGVRPDVQIINRFQISASDLDELMRREIAGRSIYWLGGYWPSRPDFVARRMDFADGYKLTWRWVTDAGSD